MDLKVFISSRESTCVDCHEDLGSKAWVTLVPGDEDHEKGALCLACADLDHLLFLAAGDATLTRRSRKYSTLCAVVLKWSRARKRYERQGLLVEPLALARAEEECLVDSDARARQRERAALRRTELDQQYVEQFAQQVRDFYPGCPKDREQTIAEHACLKYSGRVGRTAAAKEFAEPAIKLAIIAHIRHAETKYDELRAKGVDRWEAREQVEEVVYRVLDEWGSDE